MIPPHLSARLSACSPAELRVLWTAVDKLLARLEVGRPLYGTEPGKGSRDYVAEAMEEGLDLVLYLAMADVKQTITPGTSKLASAACDEKDGSNPRRAPSISIDPSGPVWVMPEPTHGDECSCSFCHRFRSVK